MVQKSEKFTSYAVGIVKFHYVPRVFNIPNGDRQRSEPSTVSNIKNSCSPGFQLYTFFPGDNVANALAIQLLVIQGPH